MPKSNSRESFCPFSKLIPQNLRKSLIPQDREVDFYIELPTSSENDSSTDGKNERASVKSITYASPYIPEDELVGFILVIIGLPAEIQNALADIWWEKIRKYYLQPKGVDAVLLIYAVDGIIVASIVPNASFMGEDIPPEDIAKLRKVLANTLPVISEYTLKAQALYESGEHDARKIAKIICEENTVLKLKRQEAESYLEWLEKKIKDFFERKQTLEKQAARIRRNISVVEENVEPEVKTREPEKIPEGFDEKLVTKVDHFESSLSSKARSCKKTYNIATYNLEKMAEEIGKYLKELRNERRRVISYLAELSVKENSENLESQYMPI